MPRWVAPLVIVTTVVVAIAVGLLWYVIGGWPRDHDRYGTVPIPGQRTLELPQGEVRLDFEGEVSGGTQTRTLEDPPPGLRVRVRARNGRELDVDEVSSSLYGVFSGGRGHEPFGKVDVPERGRYGVRTTAEEASAGGEITAGPELWNPLGSRALGAVLAGFAVLLVLLVFDLPFIIMAGRRA